MCDLLGILCLMASVGPTDAAEPDFSRDLLPIVRDNCVACHNAKRANGGVDFSKFRNQAAAKADFDLWKKALRQVRNGTMPPDEPLDAKEQTALHHWFARTYDTSANPDPGPPLIRQLTREEYEQTMRDLLRFHHSPAAEAGIAEESVVDGFPNQAGSLVLSEALLEKYFQGADIALERLFSDPGAAGARQALLTAQPSSTVTAPQAVRRILADFLKRAFRRPVTAEEIERYARIADTALQAGDDYTTALRKALKPILVSPHFLFRLESTPTKGVRRVSDPELAVRISYFLWGTMPDDELFAAAERGELAKPEVLERQVMRMLKHPKAAALTSRFLTYWLQLPHLRKALPTQDQFPHFTRSLRDAMERETWLFCDNLRIEDRSLLELLDADYTFVNAELARHYRLQEIPEKGFARVQLRPEDHRGGVLGMASILTMTSHTDRTKPTARGKWILDVLLGESPPPPPADAGNFAPPAKGRPEPKNIREKLALHATNRTCIGCHKRIDPLGFSLENYDAVGGWRDSVGGESIDNRGTLPGVGEFQGVAGLRQVLKIKQADFVENLAAQALTFALGRKLDYYDEPTLKHLSNALERNGYRYSTLILEIVKSYPFHHRRAE